MKVKYSVTARLIIIFIVLSMLASNVHADAKTDANFYSIDNQICLAKIIPSDKSSEVFSGEIDYDSLSTMPFKKSISVSGDKITINITLFMNSTEVQLDFEGRMYQSIRHSNETPVYIGVFNSNSTATASEHDHINLLSTDYEIIYFEISNDISPYNLRKDLRNSSSVTMYLRSNDGTIYDLGNMLASPVFLEGVNDQAPSDKDINWFLNILEGTYNESVNNSTRSTYPKSWGGNLHTLSFQVADYEHMYLATPYIDFSYGDVGRAADTSFSMSLKISESHRYRLVGETNWTTDTGNYNRCFQINNVQLTWTAGGNTLIKYVTPHLKPHGYSLEIGNFVGIAASVTGILPQTATLSTILSVADAIINVNTGHSQSFNTSSTSGALVNTSAYKIKFPGGYYISNSGYGLSNIAAERFEYVAFMATKDSTQSENYWTYAVADFTFELHWSDLSGQQSGSRVYKAYKELGYYNNYS